jgi:cytochrome c-type biogenesis protein CcmI
MSAGILLTLIVAGVSGYFILAPLLRADAAEAERISAAVSEERDLQSRREMLMGALKDLEDDRATGKIDQKDYTQSKTELSTETIEIMKQLDALEQARAKSSPVALPKPKADTSGSPA